MCVWGGGVQMYRKIAILSLACLLGTASGAAVDLNKDNFNAQVYDSGKTAFVKFFAPWCGHCKSMAGAWGELGTEFQDHSALMIGDVDCTQQQTVCSDHGVRGYPTLMYFKAGGSKEGEKYSGSRSKEALKAFIDTTLV